MSVPILSPLSETSRVVLPPTASSCQGMADATIYDIYDDSDAFLTGAAKFVEFAYHKFAGEIVDIEVTERNCAKSYESACMKYSEIYNFYQAKNFLGSLMGTETASFDENGAITDGSAENLNTKLPKYTFGYARRIMDAVATEAGYAGKTEFYSSSVELEMGKQIYDLQEVVENDPDLSGIIGDNRILVKKVFYKSHRSNWMFYYGMYGMNFLGNLSTYGQFSDDSTFEVVPVHQNKYQAMAYEDSLWTRTSHFSYQLKNNKCRIFPAPDYGFGPRKLWFEFVIPGNVWEEDTDLKSTIDGVNSINNVPFSFLPYESINFAGKNWIREWALYDLMEVLAQARGKTDKIPLPNDAVILNFAQLHQDARSGKDRIEDNLRDLLEETMQEKIAERDAALQENIHKSIKHVPLLIFQK